MDEARRASRRDAASHIAYDLQGCCEAGRQEIPPLRSASLGMTKTEWDRACIRSHLAKRSRNKRRSVAQVRPDALAFTRHPR